MLRAIAASKKRNDRIDAGKIADCSRCDFHPNANGIHRDSGSASHAVRFIARPGATHNKQRL
jgi:hypothetical protein